MSVCFSLYARLTINLEWTHRHHFCYFLYCRKNLNILVVISKTWKSSPIIIIIIEENQTDSPHLFLLKLCNFYHRFDNDRLVFFTVSNLLYLALLSSKDNQNFFLLSFVWICLYIYMCVCLSLWAELSILKEATWADPAPPFVHLYLHIWLN